MISIALATYNGEKYIKEQLDSIYNQTLTPDEVIVCDDCSTDSTIDILKLYEKNYSLKLFVNHEKLGVIKNFEKAISLCSGDYILLSDQDDIWLPEKIETYYNTSKSQNNTKIPLLIFSDLLLVYNNNLNTKNTFWKHNGFKINKYTYKHILYGNFVTGCSIMINREMKKLILPFPNECTMHDHWIALIGYFFGKIIIIEKPLLYYRQHNNNVTDNHIPSIKERIIKLLYNNNYRKKYLQKEIVQASFFLKIFEIKFSRNSLKEIQEFVKLNNKSYLIKKYFFFIKNGFRIKF